MIIKDFLDMLISKNKFLDLRIIIWENMKRYTILCIKQQNQRIMILKFTKLKKPSTSQHNSLLKKPSTSQHNLLLNKHKSILSIMKADHIPLLLHKILKKWNQVLLINASLAATHQVPCKQKVQFIKKGFQRIIVLHTHKKEGNIKLVEVMGIKYIYHKKIYLQNNNQNIHKKRRR